METGFVLQFRACSAKGGKPWPRPSFARVRKPCGAGRLALPRVSACAQRPGAQGWRLPPPTPTQPRSVLGRCPGKEASRPANRPAALSPRWARPAPRRASPSSQVPCSPHIIWVPAGELADILVYVLEALFGLLQLLLQSSHRDRHLLSAAGSATARQAAQRRAAPRRARRQTRKD